MASFIAHHSNTEEINFRFMKRGSNVEPESGEIVVDVGNKLCKGVYDHHHLEGKDAEKYPCSASILMEKSDDLYSETYGKKELIIKMHENPDLDSVVSAYIVHYMAIWGELPPNCESMVEYVGLVDQSKVKYDINNPANPDSIMSVFSRTHKFKKGEDRNLTILAKGFELIEFINRRIYEIEESTGEKISWGDSRVFEGEHSYKLEEEFIRADYCKYRQLLENCKKDAIMRNVRLPLSDEFIQNKEVVLSQKEFNILDLGKIPTKSPVFLKKWAYCDGWDGIMYNSGESIPRGGKKDGLTKHISGIYINPDANENGRDVCLGHVGRLLEIKDISFRCDHITNGGVFYEQNERLIPDLNYFTGFARHGNDGRAMGYKLVIPGDAVPYENVREVFDSYIKNPYYIDNEKATYLLEEESQKSLNTESINVGGIDVTIRDFNTYADECEFIQ